MNRFRITAWVVALFVALGVSVASTIASSGAATSARAAKAHSNAAKKKDKKKKKKKCPKKTKRKGKVCIKTVKRTVTVDVPNLTLANEEKAKKEAAEKKASEEAAKVAAEAAKVKAEAEGRTTAEAEIAAQKAKVVAEEAAAAAEKPALGEGAPEKGGTKAIEAPSEIPLAPAWTNAQENAQPSGNWISSMGGSTGDHYSQLTEITPSNVSQLKPQWMTQLGGAGEVNPDTSEADATEYEGVLYIPTGTDDIYAISVASGKVLWVHETELPETVADVCCGWDNRGVTIGEGKVFTDELSGSIEALNQQTGKLEWKTEFAQPSEGLTATAAPLYYHGMIFIGPVGSEYGVRGSMTAFSAKTGTLIWRHYNIPGPGEYGHESWPTNTSCAQCNVEWKHGGATTWNAPTVDPKTGDIYYSTANAGDDSDGIDRAGADLWAASILALNYKTGEFAWGYQEVHHDIWDFDASAPTEMVKATVGGKTVEAVEQSNKDGFTYLLNAETGQPVFPITETSVRTEESEASFPTQPIPTMPPFIRLTMTTAEIEGEQAKVKASAEKSKIPVPTVEHGGVVIGGETTDDFAPWALDTKPVVYPSLDAGSGDREAPPSYDPANQLSYVCGVEGWWTLSTSTGGNGEFVEGKGYENAPTALVSGGESPTNPPGTLTAYNASTGAIAWQDHWAEQCYSGIMSTGGNVLFAGQDNGQFEAYNATTGQQLWSFSTGVSVSAPASTFEWNGKQYVALYAGGNSHGPGQSGGKNQLGDELWLFALNGTSHQGPYEFGKAPTCQEEAACKLLPERPGKFR